MEIWNHCLDRLGRELPAQQFNTWIRPLQCVEEGERLRLLAPNAFVLDWVHNNYRDLLTRFLDETYGADAPELSLEIGSLRRTEVKKSHTGQTVSAPLAQQADPGRSEPSQLANINPSFSFETFVEGKSNQLARAAGMQIAENPGSMYNPLFVYGGVGLGKTHLMHAVGNLMASKHPGTRVLYLHSEGFVSEMVKALQHGTIDTFKQRMRSVNALLIDDVQFFAGKERTQEEFFHTFNALFDSQQQIILTSDRFPKEMEGLEDRLKSRFGWGLTVSVDSPDLETRVAILMSKAQQLFELELPPEVAFFIGKTVRSNIRELEGALRRTVANARFTGQPITLEFAKEALRDMIAAQDRQISIDNIQKTVAEYFKIRTSDLKSAKRNRAVARPRQLAMALAKELTNHSLPEIGEAFGGRDHTTVLYATRKVVELCETDTRIAEDYRNLLRTLSH